MVRISSARFLLLICLIALNALFAFQFMVDPLGLSPVLDARENLAWAERIAAGELPPEPFYRALLYPAVLAVLACLGLLSGFSAMLLGVAFHLLSSLLVGLIACRLWRNRGSGYLAGSLYSVYPVAMWFSVQVFDISFAIFLFLAAILAMLRACQEPLSYSRRLVWLFGSGLLGGLAVQARPNFLPPVLLLPLLPVVFSFLKGQFSRLDRGALRRAFSGLAAVAMGLGGMLFLQGSVNYKISGEFRILPWQGAYNLYAANRAGANGQYYTQRVNFEVVPEGENTTRMESEYLYRQMAEKPVELSVSAMNAFWREQLFQSIAESPASWLGLMGRKFIYLVNNWEQYNNLTYAFHKERFSALKWNPLGWGLLSLLALAALILVRSSADRATGLSLGLLFAAYAAGVLLFFVSARFRLPLAPLLCVACGAWACLRCSEISFRKWVLTTALVLGCAFLVFGNWFNAKSRETFLQDNFLLASASSQAGFDEMALSYAEQSLSLDPHNQAARRLQVSSLYNLWLLSELPSKREFYWTGLSSALPDLKSKGAATTFIYGVYLWRENQKTEAVQVWADALRTYPSESLASAQALQAVGAGSFFEEEDAGVGRARFLLQRD